MSPQHWRRDEPRFYDFLALERAPLSEPRPVHGLRGALMSMDDRSGARTLVVELPAGWRQAEDAAEASLELLVLRGDLSLEGRRVGASGYAHLPQACGGGELRSEAGALALVFWNPNMPAFPPPLTRNRALKLWEQPWVPSLPGSHFTMHKSLRLPDPAGGGYDGGPGGYLRLSYMAPGFSYPTQHVHHECFEEIVLLQGDFFLAPTGLMGLGSVICHPQEWWHAPFVTRSGALILVHTDAPMGFPWPSRDYPIGRELVETYLDTAPWDVHPEHTPWAESPWASLRERPELEGWASGPGAEAYSDEVGRGAASAFRSSWRRTG